MATPKIRHLAIFARDPHEMARYYQKVFDMKLVHTSPDGQHCFVSDGYLTMALLKHTTEGSAPVGLNHFGFSVENRAEIERRIAELGMEAPKKRPLAVADLCCQENPGNPGRKIKLTSKPHASGYTLRQDNSLERLPENNQDQ